MYSAYHSATLFFPFTSKSQCSYLPDALYSFGGGPQNIPWYRFGIIYLSDLLLKDILVYTSLGRGFCLLLTEKDKLGGEVLLGGYTCGLGRLGWRDLIRGSRFKDGPCW